MSALAGAGHVGHVVLVGLPGSGKSTVGPLLASRLHAAFVDLDSEVETRLGRSISAVFAEHGEEFFRAEELAALERTLLTAGPLVVSAGGGLIANRGAATLLLSHATVVWLDASDHTLAGRVGTAASRPLLHGGALDHLAVLRHERASAHRRAHLHVDTDGRTPAEVADDVARRLTWSVRVSTAVPYLVTVGAGVLAAIGNHLPPMSRRVALIADEQLGTLAARLGDDLTALGVTVTVLRVAAGERLKRWSEAGALLERCSEAGLDRDDCLVAVGGGTVGDVAGFVASTYLRGIAWVGVPTTLLAMVDSAVGGKTGVNLSRGKNLAGTFWQPRAVLCDPAVLGTVPERSYRSAFAEIVKSSMVGGGELPALVEARLQAALARDPEAVADLVRGCCALKAEVVGTDEREDGRRAILNYGHTVGHAVEALTGFGDGPDHGEAVAFGMRVAGALSVSAAGCPAPDVAWQNSLLDECGLNQTPQLSAAAVAERLGADKKARSGVPRWVLLRGRGRPVSGIVLDGAAVAAALQEAFRR